MKAVRVEIHKVSNSPRAVRLTRKFGSTGTFLAPKNYAQKNR